MKRLSVVAFLAALGLLVAGCGGGGGSSSAAASGSKNCPAGEVCVNAAGFTTDTIFTDGEQTASSISKFVSSATGEVPPTSPSYKRVSGVAVAPSAPAAN